MHNVKVISLTNSHGVCSGIEQQLRKIGLAFKNVSFLYSLGEIEETLYRDTEKKVAITSLACEIKNSLFVTGDSGVGKTSFIRSLAPLIKRHLPNSTLIEISTASIISGCKYRGEFEDKLSKLLEVCAENSVIIYFDEAHTLSMTGGEETGGIDALNILKPYLSSGLRCILSSTKVESRSLTKDKAFSRRFRTLCLEEMPKEFYAEIIYKKFSSQTTIDMSYMKSIIDENEYTNLYELIDLIDFKIAETKIANQ